MRSHLFLLSSHHWKWREGLETYNRSLVIRNAFNGKEEKSSWEQTCNAAKPLVVTSINFSAWVYVGMSDTIVNRGEWLWNSSKFFVVCYCSVFWPWPCTKHNSCLLLIGLHNQLPLSTMVTPKSLLPIDWEMINQRTLFDDFILSRSIWLKRKKSWTWLDTHIFFDQRQLVSISELIQNVSETTFLTLANRLNMSANCLSTLAKRLVS